MSDMIDLHRPAGADPEDRIIDLFDDDLALICDALRRRKVDLLLDRRRFDRNDHPRERDEVAEQMLTIDLLRVRLGDEPSEDN